MRDLGSNIQATTSISPASITATTTGTYVDCNGFDSVMAVIPVGAVAAADADNYVTFSAWGTNTVGGAGAVALTTYNPLKASGVVWDKLINNTNEADATYSFGIKTAGYRYIAIIGTETLTTTAVYGGIIVAGNPLNAPTLATEVPV
jgi:hypothetical protein